MRRVVLAPGDVVGAKYRLDRILGEGGMGQVWEARHEVTGKRVALKVLKSEREEDRKRLIREARAACAVHHSGIAQVHDVTELDDGSPLLVMDLLEGESLRAKLMREGALDLKEACVVLFAVLRAVGAAHATGIVHRDLKPDNVFLCKDGTVKVLDFGIAKLVTTHHDADAAGLTSSGAMLGTPYYMSPEQAFGEKDIDVRSDVWAAGVMLYECLSGERPTQADNLGQILKIITTRSFRPLAERVENLPNDISDLVERCLRLDKNDRPANAGEVLRVLDRYANAPDVPRLVVTPRPKDEPATALASTVRAVPSAPKLPETEEKPSQRPTWLFIPALVLAGAGIVYWQSLRAPPVQPTVTNTKPAPKTTESIAPEPKVSATATAPEPAPSETHAVLPAHSIRVPPTASASASAPSSARHVKVVTEPPF